MSKHFGHTSAHTVHIDCWLTIDPGSGKDWNRRPSIKVTAGEPALLRGQRAINLKMDLPLALFETPAIVARIGIEAPAAPITIDHAAVAEALKVAIGADIDLRIVPHGREE
ncbi:MULTISPECIES: hypothetical protein [unclassified Sphingobium]|uniref:hypothetical protein n=1 Tax=unclassified Sphingobium TaxID=2611147 RepID=UPI00222454AB|nr:MULTISPECIES: hypothetical protein [unclassified Sphingobium]MCW2395856.1 hypothetical protein [Sphingobium sp. B8D3B]MCW2419372.1 hypothetical protein [Sphingobium sp. B8D3C]